MLEPMLTPTLTGRHDADLLSEGYKLGLAEDWTDPKVFQDKTRMFDVTCLECGHDEIDLLAFFHVTNGDYVGVTVCHACGHQERL